MKWGSLAWAGTHTCRNTQRQQDFWSVIKSILTGGRLLDGVGRLMHSVLSSLFSLLDLCDPVSSLANSLTTSHTHFALWTFRLLLFPALNISKTTSSTVKFTAGQIISMTTKCYLHLKWLLFWFCPSTGPDSDISAENHLESRSWLPCWEELDFSNRSL